MRMLGEGASCVQLVCTGSTYGFRGDDYFKRLSAYMDEHGLRIRVHVLGLLPRAEQIALLKSASAVLQPSRFEGWSTIIEDAKSLGKAILASDIAVHREQLDGGRGILLPVMITDSGPMPFSRRPMVAAGGGPNEGPRTSLDAPPRQPSAPVALLSRSCARP